MSSPPFLFLCVDALLKGGYSIPVTFSWVSHLVILFQKEWKWWACTFGESVPLDQKVYARLPWNGMLSCHALRSSSTKAVFSLAFSEISRARQTFLPQGRKIGRGLQGWQSPAMKMGPLWPYVCHYILTFLGDFLSLLCSKGPRKVD